MGIGNMTMLFVIPAAVGIIAALSVRHNNKMQREKKKQGNQVVNTINTISANHIQDLILPNNMGRPIEKVISTLAKENIDPQFYIDCFPERQETK